MKGILQILFWALFFWILYAIFKVEIDEWFEARKQKIAFLREKRRLERENREKEILKAYLERKLRYRLYLGYTLIMMSFIIVSIGFSLIVFSAYDFMSVSKGMLITQGAIFSVSVYIYREPLELKYILTNLAPFLQKRVYSEHINIDSEIELNLVRIGEIDQELARLNRKLAFKF